MGREIRRVPPNWEHPENEYGEYIPLLDRDFPTILARWEFESDLWERGEHPMQFKFPGKTIGLLYRQWDGDKPVAGEYRPAWAPEEATAFQVYESTSEGTPVSPVFQDTDALIAWLVRKWHLSQKDASGFVALELRIRDAVLAGFYDSGGLFTTDIDWRAYAELARGGLRQVESLLISDGRLQELASQYLGSDELVLSCNEILEKCAAVCCPIGLHKIEDGWYAHVQHRNYAHDITPERAIARSLIMWTIERQEE